MKGLLSMLLLLVLTFAGASVSLQPIVIKGSKFFSSDGAQFFIKGVVYQPKALGVQDPLADAMACKRDVPYLQDLGTNTIRVNTIDPTKNHDECMKLLDAAGIYVISDLSEPNMSIDRNSPAWDDKIYKRYTGVIDALAGYSNVMGFFAGNGVSNMYNNTDASAFVKAAIRDTKAYLKSKGHRSIPVGYATYYYEDIRTQLADYFNCGNAEDRAEFWGYNIYSWCGDSSYTRSGYDQRTAEFKDYSIPSFFSEYGCNTDIPEGGSRKFTEVQALYSKPMTDVFSGGIVYMYFEEGDKYGLVKTRDGGVTKLGDFNNLKSQISRVKPQGVTMSSFTPSNTLPRDCPVVNQFWKASSTLPPTPNESLCQCMVKSLGCVAKSSVSDKAIRDLFNIVCGQANSDCSAITANGTSGTYGAFSMCSANERLSWAFNMYYDAHGKSTQSCDFNGNATTQTPETNADCKSTLQNASNTPKSTGP